MIQDKTRARLDRWVSKARAKPDARSERLQSVLDMERGVASLLAENYLLAKELNAMLEGTIRKLEIEIEQLRLICRECGVELPPLPRHRPRINFVVMWARGVQTFGRLDVPTRSVAV